MQTPWKNLSKLSKPSDSRLARVAARLLLLVACAGVVATSQATSPDVTTEFEGEPLTLTMQAPLATRHFILRMSAAKGESDPAEGELTAKITARWMPADPTSPVKPWLNVGLSDDHNPFESNRPLALGEPGQPTTTETTIFLSSFGCELEKTCEWDVSFQLDLQGDAFEGAVEVDWKLVVVSRAVNTSKVPKGFEVQVEEVP